jgi:hypothetical protein
VTLYTNKANRSSFDKTRLLNRVCLVDQLMFLLYLHETRPGLKGNLCLSKIFSDPGKTERKANVKLPLNAES